MLFRAISPYQTKEINSNYLEVSSKVFLGSPVNNEENKKVKQ